MKRKALPAGTVLKGTRGRYIIEEVIGRGGFALTYRARTSSLTDRRYVAIKEFFPLDICSRTEPADSQVILINRANDFEIIADLRENFIRESRNIQKCRHNGIVEVYEVIETNGTAYMVMEMIDGQTVKRLISRYLEKGRSFPSALAKDIILQLAEAVSYLHGRGVLHLDIKPDNVMLTELDREVVLIDFGLSKVHSVDFPVDSSGTVAVSPGYASPEHYDENQEFTPASDVYGLGATFYKILTGVTPPAAPDLKSKKAGLVFDDSMPENFSAAIIAAMHPNPRKRLQTVDDFIALVEEDYDENEDYDDIDERENEIGRKTDHKPSDGDKDRLNKWLLNMILLAVIAGSVYQICVKNYADNQIYNRFFLQSNKFFILSCGITAGVALIGIIVRSYGFKILMSVTTLTVLIMLYLNAL